MEEALRTIEENQSWIYFVLLVIGVAYLRVCIIRANELGKAVFGLERERSLSKLTQAGAMLALVIAVAVAVFVVANFMSPAFPSSARMTQESNLGLPSAQQAGTEPGQGALAPTLAILNGFPSVGCPDQNVRLSWPEDTSTVSGVVEVRGTANNVAFGFYQYHYMLMSPEASWNVVAAGDEPKNDEVLGVWDTTWLVAGEYFLRLVVTDASGVASPVCVIQVRVVPSP
jgi:hypothetical protein